VYTGLTGYQHLYYGCRIGKAKKKAEVQEKLGIVKNPAAPHVA
jgi:hypothetical protein